MIGVRQRMLAGLVVAALALPCISTVPHAHGQGPAAKFTPLRQISLKKYSALLSLSPDGTMQAVYENENLCVYGTIPWRRLRCAQGKKMSVDNWNVAWSPDGTRIAYTENWAQYFFNSDIHVMDVATGKQRDLTDDQATGKSILTTAKGPPAMYDGVPAWSPDSKWIYFARSIAHSTTTTIDRIPSRGGNVQLIVNAAPDQVFAIYYGMAVTPSDQQVVYTLSYNDLKNPTTGLYVAGLFDQGGHKVLGSTPESGPPLLRGLALNGTVALVEYYQYIAQFFARTGSTGLALVDLNSGVTQPVIPHGVTRSAISPMGGAAISPDGTKLLYTYASPRTICHLVLRDLRTGAEVELPLSAANRKSLTGYTDTGTGLSWGQNNIVFVGSRVEKGALFQLTI